MDNHLIIESFGGYCRKCKGRCCNGIMVGLFDWELPRTEGHNLPSSPKNGVLNITFEKDCLLLKDHRCCLPSEDRLLDCLSYPVYPRIEDGKVAGLIIHKGCPYHEEIARDAELVGMVKRMWEENLDKLKPEQVREFFSGEFWDKDRLDYLTI
ncbi:MAG: hypothetical protein ACYDFU_04440 [Nitrospirota bacterium]